MTAEVLHPLLQRLKADKLFGSVSNALLARLLGSDEEVSLASGDTLYKHGDQDKRVLKRYSAADY